MASIIKVDQWQTSAGIPKSAIINVVTASLQSTFVGTGVAGNNYFVNLTGLSATITPESTTSRILIYTNLYLGVTTTALGYQQGFRILRNGGTVNSLLGNSEGGRPQVSGTINNYGAGGSATNQQYRVSMLTGLHQDSPATTSALTYSIQLRGYTGSPVLYVNRSQAFQASGSDYDHVPVSTLVLMEVAA
jgi:hypothetical protein